MSNKNWRDLGPVIVEDRKGGVVEFTTIEAAVAQHYYKISHLTYGRLGTFERDIYGNLVLDHRGYTSRIGGDDVVFRDEMGFTIPLWKVKEVWKQTQEPVRRSRAKWWLREAVRYSREGEGYRCEPVYGVHKSRGGWHHYRRMATTQERRENDFLAYDDDLYGLDVRVRGERVKLPTYWDDRRPGRGRWSKTWKRHRSHQRRGGSHPRD